MAKHGEAAFWAYAVPGMVLQCAARSVSHQLDGVLGAVAMTAAYSIGTILLWRGIAGYARSLNRSAALGALGVLSVLGVIVIMCFDKKKIAAQAN